MLFPGLAILILLSFQVPVAAGQDLQLVVIGNDKGVPANLKLSEARAIFKGEKRRWKDRTKVVIALMRSSCSIGAQVSRKLYHLSPDDFNKHWIAQVFRGKASAPKYFLTEKELIAFVNSTPGAIGIISAAAADSSARIIQIDGKKGL